MSDPHTSTQQESWSLQGREDVKIKPYAGAGVGRLTYRLDKVFEGFQSSTPRGQEITIYQP